MSRRLTRRGTDPGGVGASRSARALEGRGALADRGLAVGGLVLVDDTGGRRLVEPAVGGGGQRARLVGVPGVGGLAEPAAGGLERRLPRLVALVRKGVLPVAPDLGLDVRHGAGLDRRSSCGCLVKVRRARQRRAAYRAQGPDTRTAKIPAGRGSAQIERPLTPTRGDGPAMPTPPRRTSPGAGAG